MKTFKNMIRLCVLGTFVIFLACDNGSKFKATDADTVEDTDTDDSGDDDIDLTNTDLDILLVIDDSGSMYKDNEKLAGYLGDLADEMSLEGIDWQMCVTTTDVSYYEGRTILWKSNNNSNIVNASSNIPRVFNKTIEWIGHGWSDDEQGIKAMNLAINEPDNSNCFRDGASLAVILISDEDERSVGGKQSLSSVQYKKLNNRNSPSVFMDSVFSKFGGSKRVAVHSIVVDDSACRKAQDAEGSPSFIGLKYMELSELSGGSVMSICDDDYLIDLNIYGDL